MNRTTLASTLALLMLPLALTVGCAPPTNQTLDLGSEALTDADAMTASELPPPTYTAAAPAIELPPPSLPPAPAAPAQTVRPAPTPPPPSTTPQPRIHVVQRGDTVWSLSGRYYGRASHANVRRIVGANPGLDPDHIRIGQEIVIPE